jgi:trans-2-enoyl-CoA reductase
MCTVSMIGDFYGDKWKDLQPFINPNKTSPYTNPIQDNPIFIPQPNQIDQQRLLDLEKEVKDMKELLKRAKIYDEVNNQKDCELEDKMKFLKEVAKLVGIDLDDILKK